MRADRSNALEIIEAPPQFPEDTRLWEHPFLATVRAALDRQIAGVILDLARTVSLGPHGAAALFELAKYAGFVGGVVLLQNVPDALVPALSAAGIDRVCFVRRARAADEVEEIERTTQAAGAADPNSDPHVAEREPRRRSGGVLRLEPPDADPPP